MSNNLKQLEGGRAAFAYQCVKDAQQAFGNDERGQKGQKAYKSYAKKIPMLIKTNGLGATFSFILSKQKNEPEKKEYAYKLLYDKTTEWLNKEDKRYLLAGTEIETEDDDALVARLIKLPSHRYRAVTVEVIALFSWLRRFADGLIDGEDEDQ